MDLRRLLAKPTGARETPPNLTEATAPYAGRVWAPFHLRWSAYYDHGYRKPGEHYHRNLKELEACPLFPEDRKVYSGANKARRRPA